MKENFHTFALWDLAAWFLATHLTPSDLAELRCSLLDDPSHVRDAGMSLGLDRTSDNPPQDKKSHIMMRAA